MVTLSTSGNSIILSFQDNQHYLNNGVITAPKNSLILVTDDSDMATLKKIDGDVFVSALYSELGMTKNELETWFKENATTNYGGGGGGGDVTSAQVQTMIDESISGKADAVSAVCSAEYVESSTTIDFKNIDGTVISSIDASDFIIDGMIENVSIETISGVSYLVIDFNTASGKEDIQIPLTDIFDPSNYYTKSEVDAALSGKIDTSAITSSITWASTDSQVPSAKALYNERLYAGDGIDIEGKLIYATYRGFPGYTEDTFHPFDEDFYIKIASDCPDATTSESHINVNKDEEFYTYYIYCDYENGISEVTCDDPNAPVWLELFNIDWDSDKGMFHVYKGFLGDEYEMEFYDDVCSRYSVWGHGESMWTTDAIDDLDARLNDKADTSSVTESIEAAVSGKADTSAVTASINAAVSGKVDTSAYTAYTASTETAIGNKADTSAVTAVNNVVTAHTADTTIHVTSSDKSTWSGKQDALVSGTNIKTINNQSLLGSGNITISGGGSGNSVVECTQAEYDALVSGGTIDPDVFYIITDATPVDLSGYAATSAVTEEINAAVSGKADTSAVTASINAAVSGKQDTLVSGTNIKTINNESILGSGNITIQGGGSGMTSGEVQTMIDESISGKVDASAVTSSVTSASTDSEIPTAKAVYDAIPTGGTSITIDPTLDSGSTNPVANSAITNGINSRLLDVYYGNANYVGQGVKMLHKTVNSSSSTGWGYLSSINNKSIIDKDYTIVNKFSLVETSAITTSITSGSTDVQVPSAKCVYDQLGGLKLAKVTQAEYDALVSGGTVDNSTLYIITNVVN